MDIVDIVQGHWMHKCSARYCSFSLFEISSSMDTTRKQKKNFSIKQLSSVRVMNIILIVGDINYHLRNSSPIIKMNFYYIYTKSGFRPDSAATPEQFFFPFQVTKLNTSITMFPFRLIWQTFLTPENVTCNRIESDRNW